QFDLSVTATSIEGGDPATAVSTSGTLHVDVTVPVPTLSVSNASGNEDQAIALNILPGIAQPDPNAVIGVTIARLPSGVTLSNTHHDPLTISPGGTVALTAAQLAGLALTSDGETQHFDLTVTATAVEDGDTAGAASTSKTLHVDVTPVAEPPVL